LLFFLANSALLSNSDEDKTVWDKILDKYWNIPVHLQNSPTIELTYGLAQPDFTNTEFSGKLALAYSLDLKYGFTRFYGFKGMPYRFYYASEFAFMSNLSSHIKPRQIPANGITTDNWRFGIGYRNGYGYEFGSLSKVILYHASSLVWSTVDFESSPQNQNDLKTINKYDEITRFGQSFEGGAIYSLTDIVNITAGVENQVIFPRHNFGQWLVPLFGELIIQRTIDFFGDELLQSNKDSYPVLNAALKYTISYILFTLKRNNMNWPFESAPPMTYSNYKIGFTFIF
jgi:hypothetical protein